jgi:hypothetical protein
MLPLEPSHPRLRRTITTPKHSSSAPSGIFLYHQAVRKLKHRQDQAHRSMLHILIRQGLRFLILDYITLSKNMAHSFTCSWRVPRYPMVFQLDQLNQLFQNLVFLLLQLLLAIKRLVREGSVLDHERLEGTELAKLS